MSIPPKMIYRFNVIARQIAVIALLEVKKKQSPKVHIKHNCLNSQNSLEKENQS